jgi:hypothetical protein
MLTCGILISSRKRADGYGIYRQPSNLKMKLKLKLQAVTSKPARIAEKQRTSYAYAVFPLSLPI